MSSNIRIGAQIDNTSSNKLLQRDDQGYYKVILGAVNSYNSLGEYYGDNYVEDLFKPDTYIGRMLANGSLLGEVNHPQFVPGMSKFDYFMRNNRVDQLNASHFIKNIEIVNSGKIEGGRPKKLIVGWIKPIESNPGGKILKELLDTPGANVCFSVRCIIEPTSTRDNIKIKSIITFDWVDLPGIKEANKLDTLELLKNERFINNIEETMFEHTTLSIYELRSNLQTYQRASGEDGVDINNLLELTKPKAFSALQRF